jgi:predicted phage-related endonuclease
MNKHKDVKMPELHIGGNDAACIIGANRWHSPLEIWQVKTNRRQREDVANKNAVKWGKINEKNVIGAILEPCGISYYDKDNDTYVYDMKPCQTYVEKDFMVGFLDYVLEDGTIIEAKTSGEWGGDEWKKGIPEYAYWQVVHYMAITGATKAYVGCLVGGRDIYIHKMTRNEAEIETLMAKEQEFVQMVKDDVEPMELPPVNEMEEYAMDADVERLAEKYVDLSTQVKALEEEKTIIKKALGTLIGQNHTQESEHYKATYKWVERETVDMKWLAQEVELEKYKRKGGYYRLDVKDKEGR